MSKPAGFSQPGSSYGWVVVGAGALMTCVGFGTMLSLAVFLQPIATDTGWSVSGVSAAATIDFLAMGFAAFFWGALSDRFGTRIVVLAGAVLLGIGLVGASQAASLWQFQFFFGVLIGIAAGSFYAPMVAAASAWIEHRRSLAVALVSAGMGVSPLTIAPFASYLITAYDWRTAMLVIGIASWALLIPASFLVRPAPPAAAPVSGGPDVPEVQWTVGQALRTPQFITLALAHFACCAAHSGPIFHMVSYAMICGIAPLTAVTVYSLAGFSGLGGRLLLGVMADRLGAKPVLVGGLFVQAMSVATYLAVGQLGEFYALSVIFGLAYGGVMPLYAVLVREYFGARIMGTVFGAVSAFASLGMALGPLAGGWVFDTFHAYNWLYVGSFAIGITAVAVALSFPSAKRPSQPSLDLGRAAA
ncbi:MFS transporter [Bradyrhizobium sp. AUGA SZCCT0240]|uniref:MFS transporter n=1 Tax=unclassified Bradyrhizobium TaxID=2631580 RepID=UPI001BA87C90|nr:MULTISPECIES: MFS transporter [unclassified Bradyrhizobium]MBR1193440.1 MFS transporter [Bradyrhizobium sp. AUGA SZCCT0160]MBR1201106.1 MFS transporter [Bradyrhizobium sp. AUGA SZCCT0158]MBR1242688.1 MFS transporter [Bradyrhizobium sp. AUGA SZCCT0274]MBR1251997.1 MFS transporter [Bradyrhizobium sp. AUGA SZCCT0169]MBR1258930.1 MFS transporter [Bradyrhizobium sp. AUGA SZCCT0240]